MIFFLVNICTPDFLAFVHNLRMKYIDSNKLSDPQFKRYTGISWSTFYLMVEQLQKHVPAQGIAQVKLGGSGSALSELLAGITNLISRCDELQDFRAQSLKNCPSC